MTDPLKLAEEIERAKRWYVNEHDGETRLLAAALRLAESCKKNAHTGARQYDEDALDAYHAAKEGA